MRNTTQLGYPALEPTGSTTITFSESALPANCLVFGHLIIDIPAKLSEAEIKTDLEQFARSQGGDFMLLGLARRSDSDPNSIRFRSYGPPAPYSFARDWVGWKYGLSDWHRGGPLVNYGTNQMSDERAAFEFPLSLQAILLSCPATN